MPQFPALKSGAVAQYPLQAVSAYRTDILEFIDGSEQRIPEFASALKSWVIDLTLLDEAEMSALTDFFLSAQGRYGSFSFVDPETGVEYPNCSLGEDTIRNTMSGWHDGRVSITVHENRQ